MATTIAYLPDQNGWYRGTAYYKASVRLKTEVTYNDSNNTTTVKITPQLHTDLNAGNDYRMYGYNLPEAGIYVNGTKVFSFSNSHYSGNVLYFGSAHGGWVNPTNNWSYTFTVPNNSSGTASFSVGIICSVLSMYYYQLDAPVDPTPSPGSGGGGGGSSIHVRN